MVKGVSAGTVTITISAGGITLSDITSEIDYAVANNLWLIILFHRVDETDPCCSSISVDHSLIQGTVDYLVQQHVPVVTNNEGLIIENPNAQN